MRDCCSNDSWVLTLRLVFRLALFLKLNKMIDWAQEEKRLAIELRHGHGRDERAW